MSQFFPGIVDEKLVLCVLLCVVVFYFFIPTADRFFCAGDQQSHIMSETVKVCILVCFRCAIIIVLFKTVILFHIDSPGDVG